jgi:glycosyltransferase involved in cell wall biosynthesis
MITINGRFVGKRITGVQRYAHEIVAELDKLVSGDLSLRGQVQIVVRGQDNGASLKLQSIKVVPSTSATGIVWTQIILPLYNKGTLISLENISSLAVSPQILCVHDINTILCPESYQKLFRIYYRVMVPLGMSRAKSVVTVSNFSARMISEAGLCPASKITVIPNGHEHALRWDYTRSPYMQDSYFPRPFIFLLGSQARHKNLDIIRRISRDIAELGLDIVVAGPKEGPFESIESEGANPNIKLLGFVSDDDLAALFKRAFCFVFPSLTEGFGLPALEALARGCPVIASNAASLPEVCGEATLYADPRAPAEWLVQIRRLKDNPHLRAELIANGYVQAKKFSWAKSAALYRDLAAEVSHER